jgi:hypothetical protein
LATSQPLGRCSNRCLNTFRLCRMRSAGPLHLV